MSHVETFQYTVEEVKRTQADAAKRGAIWAVDPSGNRRPLGEAANLLMNLRLVLQSGTPGLIEPPITHGVKNPVRETRIIVEDPKPINDIPEWKRGSYKNWINPSPLTQP